MPLRTLPDSVEPFQYTDPPLSIIEVEEPRLAWHWCRGDGKLSRPVPPQQLSNLWEWLQDGLALLSPETSAGERMVINERSRAALPIRKTIVGQTLRAGNPRDPAAIRRALYGAERAIDGPLYGRALLNDECVSVSRVRLSGNMLEKARPWLCGSELIAQERTCLWMQDITHLCLPLAYRVLKGGLARRLAETDTSPIRRATCREGAPYMELALTALEERIATGNRPAELEDAGAGAGWPWLHEAPVVVLSSSAWWATKDTLFSPRQGRALDDENAWLEKQLFALGAPRDDTAL